MENSGRWDKYFYKICNEVSKNSKCLSRKIGCIMVKDKTILGSGYNGPPRGIPRCDERWSDKKDWNLVNFCEEMTGEDPVNFPFSKYLNRCPRYVLGAKSGEMLEICIAGHAERNTLINAARMGIKTYGCKLYMTCGIPCKDCMIEIINAGIEELVVTSLDYYDKQTKYLVDNSDIIIRKFSDWVYSED